MRKNDNNLGSGTAGRACIRRVREAWGTGGAGGRAHQTSNHFLTELIVKPTSP